MSTATTKRDILESLKDQEYRAAFNLEHVYTTICFQIRALREQREMSQGALGKKAKPRMAQERISILEDPNAETKPTLNTMLRLAEAFDVGLDVRFVPFSKVLNNSVHTDMGSLEVPSFTDELPSLQSNLETIAAVPVWINTQGVGTCIATGVSSTVTGGVAGVFGNNGNTIQLASGTDESTSTPGSVTVTNSISSAYTELNQQPIAKELCPIQDFSNARASTGQIVGNFSNSQWVYFEGTIKGGPACQIN